MKKAIGILALLVFAGNIASAELLKDFKWDGKITVNGYSTKNNNDTNSDAKDTTSDVDTRVEINAGFNLAEDADAVLTAVKCNRSYAAASESVGGVADLFFFEQAYLNLKGVLGLDHKIGRQYYGEAGDLVIHYGPSASLFDTTLGVNNLVGSGNELGISGVDGLSAWYTSDKLNIHAMTAKVANTRTVTNTDTDVVGVAAKYSLMEVINPAAYFYEKKDYGALGVADETADVVGVKGTGKFLGFEYYGELAKNYGHNHSADTNYTGKAFLAGAKYDLDLVGKWSFTGEMGIGSGDDETFAANEDDNTFQSINSDYRPGMIWGGVNANRGLGNLTTWNLGAKWVTPMFEKLTLGGKILHYSPTVTKINATAAGAAKTDIGYDTYGNELDLCANWQHNENVGLKAYYAAFMVDSDFADIDDDGLNNGSEKDDVATLLGVALTVKF